MFIRNIFPRIQQVLSQTPAIFLKGARQTGKTTIARQICEESMRTDAAHDHPMEQRSYLSFDDVQTRFAAQEDPDGFIARLKMPVVLDEIQRVPNIMMSIKADIDRNPNPGRYILTSSVNSSALSEMADSLSGRIFSLPIHTISHGELHNVHGDIIASLFEEDATAFSCQTRTLRTVNEIIDAIVSGGYPDAQQQYSQMYRKIWFSNYMSALMDRDIHDLANIDHPVGLHYLLLMLSARSGTLFNQSDVSRACAIPNSTAIRYMTMLEDLHLVWRLPAWSGDLGRRVIKMPKVHVADSGLACHLCGADEERLTGDPAQMARLLETFVANELRKQATWTGHPVSLFHFSHRGGEVDMVLEDTAGRVVGVDVKLSGTVVDRDARGLAVLRDALGDRFVRGVILYGGQQTLPFGDRLLAAPFGTLLPPARPGTEVTPSGAA